MKKSIILSILFILSAFVVYADTAPTCSITLPASSTTYAGSEEFRATITSNGTGSFNVTGVNFTVSSTVVGSNTTGGKNLSSYIVTVNTATISDTASTTVTANIIINSTKYLGSCTATSVGFDNTNPVCSCSLENEIIESLSDLGYDCSSSTDVTALTYSCIATYDSGSTETETREKGEFSDTESLGEATVSCTVTDAGANTNTCSDLTTTIQNTDNGGGTTQPTIITKNNSIILIGIILFIFIIVAAVASMSMRKSKGKGKRKKR